MDTWVIEVALAGPALVGWFALYGVLWLVTRPRANPPEPATQDLGPEPPAVASLVGNGWDLTEDAAEATLLDLGARGVLEFRQPADDPAHTTIHIVQSSPSGLLPYERRVFDRVAGLAIRGADQRGTAGADQRGTAGAVVPLTALTFRDPKQAKAWWKDLRGEVIADARVRGVSQRRFARHHVAILTAAAALAAVLVAIAVAHHVFRGDDEDPLGAVITAGFVTFAVLTAVAGLNVGERDTPAGREAAARWLGVRAWLRAHDAFAELPPSAVAVWGRYIGYGAALGTARVASAIIDMGMGSRRRVWSSFGGTWHRVRVSYPRFWPRYGRRAATMVTWAVLAGVAGAVLVRWWRPVLAEVSADFAAEESLRNVARLVSTIGFGLGVALLAYAVYVLVRVVIDAARPLTLIGEVLWVQVWREKRESQDAPAKPWLAYLAIDSGPSDRTTAWGLPYEMVGRCDTGDTVTVTVRPWTRRVLTLAPAPATTTTTTASPAVSTASPAVSTASPAVSTASPAVSTASAPPSE